MSDEESLVGKLRRHGYRVTPPRQRVWQVLESGEHLTAEEIARRIADGAGPDVNLASVYRSLALLEELDLVRSSRLGEGSTTWERAHPDEHFHLVCRQCGNVSHHRGTLVDQVANHLRLDHGFDPEDIELVVTGRCVDCTARAN
jgi:Fur family transcriptional regulator, ferric uptake regulator